MTAQTYKNWLLAHALWLGLLWGFAEGCVFFIVPDVLISFIALFAFKRSVQCMSAVLMGSLIAGAGLYGFALVEPDRTAAIVHAVPFIEERMFTKVHADYRQHGVIAMLMGPASGIPYKIYATLAPRYTSLISFILTSIPARLERFIITWTIFAGSGFILRKRSELYARWILTAHGLYWVAVYTYYLSVVVNEYK